MNLFMDETRKRELMIESIEEAKKSKAEDSRPHPKVGAILADANGKILYRSHRGEEVGGGHAEFHIFEKAKKDNCDLRDATLFVTLEPCTRRGKDKIPCAVRVAESGIKKIVIGTLDPNPHITGRGEIYLSFQNIEVDRFPGELARQLQKLNEAFFEQYRNAQIPAVSPYAGNASSDDSITFRPALAGQREGILQQSMALISGTSRDIFIFAGDLSWLRELQISLVLAKHAGRQIKILCDPGATKHPEFAERLEIARHLGADVGVSAQTVPIRGTLVSPDTGEAAMMCVEREPTKHAVLFQAPHETGIIKAMEVFFQCAWKESHTHASFHPILQKIDPGQIAAALKKSVVQYVNAAVTVKEVNVAGLKPLATALERFKLFRLHQVALLQESFKSECVVIRGSPWAIFPPVVEVLPNGEQIVIDGAHRVFAANQRGRESVQAVVVSGAMADLPAKPLASWDDVKLKTAKLPRDQRYRDYKPENFRLIRTAIKDFVKSQNSG